MNMSAAAVLPSSSAMPPAWLRPAQALQRLRGRWRTAFKPRAVYVHAGLHADLHVDRAASPDEAYAAVSCSFGAWCAEHVGERCMVGLSSRWLLHALLDAELNEQDAVAQAVQQWAHYMDVDAATLQADWILRRAKVGGRQIVSAAPAALVHGLLDAASAHGVRLAWVGPWWARGAQCWLQAVSDQTEREAERKAGASEGKLALLAQEPGLVTRIEADGGPDQAGQLQRIWMEVDKGCALEASSVVVSLASPEQMGLPRRPHHDHVWDQDGLLPMLQGEPATWGGQR